MTPKIVNARAVLASLQQDPDFQTCYLANSEKQLYTLDVLHVDAERLRVELRAPAGRSHPVDPSETWDFTFRTKDGVFQGAVAEIVPKRGSLVFRLQDKLCFLARRKNIRFSPASRSPTMVHFIYEGKELEGTRVDLSLEGIGIQMPRDTQMRVGHHVREGSFELRSCRMNFHNGRIAHMSFTETHLRVGLVFEGLAEHESEVIQEMFHSWCRSQRPSLSVKCDG